MRIVDHRCRSSIVDADRRSSMSKIDVDVDHRCRLSKINVDIDHRCDRCRSSLRGKEMSVDEDGCRSSIIDHRCQSYEDRRRSVGRRSSLLVIIDVDRTKIDIGCRSQLLIIDYRSSMSIVRRSTSVIDHRCRCRFFG